MAIDYAEREVAVSQSLDDDELLNPRQAAAFLAQLWQRPFTTKDFNNLRLNAQKKAERTGIALSTLFPIEPVFSDTRLTLWRRGDLRCLAANVEPPKLREEVRGRGKRRSK